MKDLIIKINDRNIQRKRESGLTGYVLISGLIICLYKLFDFLEFLLVNSKYESANINESVELVCYTFNILICCGALIFLLFPNRKTLDHIKFLKHSKTEEYITLSTIILGSIGTILILYVFFTKQNPDYTFYFYCILIFTLNLLIWVSILGTIIIEKSKRLLIVEDISKLVGPRILLFLSVLILIIVPLSLLFIYYIQIPFKSVIIKIAILSYLSYAIVEKILEVNSNDLFYSKLEAFEYEIILRKIEDEDQIRREFQERFSGFMVVEWISNQVKLAEFRLLSYNQNIENLNSQIKELQIKNFSDNTLQQKLEDEKALHTTYYSETCLKQKKEVQDAFANNLSQFDDFEKESLNQLIKILETQT